MQLNKHGEGERWQRSTEGKCSPKHGERTLFDLFNWNVCVSHFRDRFSIQLILVRYACMEINDRNVDRSDYVRNGYL